MRIEQMLHGYDNGHRLLAGSILLKSNVNMDMIATMSDWSEYVAKGGGESSYVTAYPLVESSYYVIAKTWYADEMKRPGCVWTHSLLIPFDNLNIIDDFKRISKLFKRPEVYGHWDAYSCILEYENRDYVGNDFEVLKIDRKMVVTALNAFMNGSNEFVLFNAIRDNRLAEALMLAIMNTQPLAMLRNTSWCTGTAYLRKINGKPLTCQYLSRSADTSNEISVSEEDKWQTYVVDAIIRGDVNKGQLIRMFADDICSSEKKYSAIVCVLYTLEDYFETEKNNEMRYKDVLGIIAKAFPNADEGSVIKKLCTNKEFSDRYCSDQVFFYFLATLATNGAFNTVETKIDERWKNFIDSSREQYIPLLKLICNSEQANQWGMGVLQQSVYILTADEITAILRHDFNLFSTLAMANPVLLDIVQWEILTKKEIETLLSLILDSRVRDGFSKWETLFTVLLKQGVSINDKLAKELFARNEKATRLLLDFVNKDSKRVVSPSFAEQLKDKTKDVLVWLHGVDTITDNVSYAIVNAVNERSKDVVLMGAEVWRPFLGLQFHSLHSNVYAYIFVLSFNWITNWDALELMRMAFYPLHTLLSRKELKYSDWSVIAPYMEPVMIWEEWDNCKKIRKTVVKRLKRANADISILEHFTPNKDLNKLLMKMW